MRTRALLIIAVLALCACPISVADAPTFASSCTETTCAAGYFCNEVAGACVPGEAPAPPTIVSFTIDKASVRPDEEFTLTWDTVDAVSCSIDIYPDEELPATGSVTKSLADVGDHPATLLCVSGAGISSTEVVNVHVRVVLTGDLDLASPEDIADSVEVEEVIGSVTMTGEVSALLADLKLRFVTGNLLVFNVTDLGALNLSALERVDGNLAVRASRELLSASFPRLVHVGGDFIIASQGLLNDSGTPSRFATLSAPLLEQVGGAVALSPFEYEDNNTDGIADNVTSPADNTLPDLEIISLDSLATVGGSFRLEGGSMETLPLPSLTSVGGALVIFAATHLLRIDIPLENLGGGLILEGNEALASVKLNGLRTMGSTREIIGDAYERFYEDALACSEERFEVGDIFFVANQVDGNPCGFDGDNDTIETVELDGLETVEGRLLIAGLFVSNVALPELTSAGGIVLRRNNALAGASFPKLETIGARGLVFDNDDNITGLDLLNTVTGDLVLAPSSFPTLSSLTTIGGTFSVDFLTQAELARFPVLASVGALRKTGGSITSFALPSITTVGSLVISGATVNAVDLCGLTTATSISVSGTTITTLDGFANLTSATSLTFGNNAQVAACLVDALGVQSGATQIVNNGNVATAPVPCAIDPAPVCGD